MGMLLGSGLAGGKEPAQELLQAEKPQTEVQLEANVEGEVVYPQDKMEMAHPTHSPKIVLEKMAIVVTKNDKEIKKIFVKDTEECSEVLDELKKKGLEKDEKVEVEEIKSPKIKFVNESGKVIKEILLSNPGSDKWAIHIKNAKKPHPRLKEPHLIEEVLTRDAVVSKNKTNAVIIETISEALVPETEEEEKAMDGTDAGFLGTKSFIKYLDAFGNIIWEKQTPQNMVAGSVKISDDGEVIAFLQGYVMGGLAEEEPGEKLLVYNKKGQELFKLPDKREDNYHNLRLENISPSGKYLGVAGSIGYGKGRKDFTLFYNTQTKKFWSTNENYRVVNLMDNGQCRVGYRDAKKGTKWINLKEYLGD